MQENNQPTLLTANQSAQFLCAFKVDSVCKIQKKKTNVEKIEKHIIIKIQLAAWSAIKTQSKRDSDCETRIARLGLGVALAGLKSIAICRPLIKRNEIAGKHKHASNQTGSP